MDNNLKANDLNVMSQVFQQYRDLRLNGSKFFYYSYARLDMKLQRLEKDSYGKDIREVLQDGMADLKVRVHFDEIKELLQVDRLQRRDLDNMKKDLIANSHFEIVTNEITDIFFIYERITINSKEKYIDVFFNDYAIILHDITNGNPFTKIIFDDIIQLSTKYQMNLYTYAMTVLRKGGGIITRNIDDLREILANGNNSNDYVFVNRFITTPAKEITSNNNIGIRIKVQKKGNNIQIAVNNKKEATI